MDFLTYARNPWGQEVLVRISWDLLWVAVIGGALFLVGHAVWLRFWPRPAGPRPDPELQRQLEAKLPERVPRHSLASRLFHWVMAASMLVLLFTGFLPVVGVQFAWVTWHWVAGVILTLSFVYHIIHASFWLDFWGIWPDRTDMRDASRRIRRNLGQDVPPPGKHPKYPLENKLYHLALVGTGFAVVITGIFMMFRISTPLFPRNPYLFGDQTWGVMYVLHGLAGVGLVALTMAHIYFALRPEKFWITKSMVFGWITRGHYVEHHDPRRWPVTKA